MAWYDRSDLTAMKIGTMPLCMVLVHGSDRQKLTPGNWVRIKEAEGDKWHQVLVTKINDGGDIFAAR